MPLIAHFKLDTNTLDSIGTYTTTPSNITYSNLGKIDASGVFNGTSSFITLSSTINLAGNANWMVSVWVKTTSTTRQSILSNSSGGPVMSDMCIEGGKIAYYHYNATWLFKQGNIIVNDGKWHHLIWVNFLGNKMSMYVDGVLDASTVDSTQSTGPVNQIGKNWTSNYFNGQMDDFRIYNDSLLNKIQKLSFTKAQMAHWPLNGNLNDYSGKSTTLLNPSGDSTLVTTGKIGQAYTKTTGYYDTGISKIPDEVTISMWFRHNGTTWTSECLFGTRVSNDGFMLYRNSGDAVGYYRIYFWYNNTSSNVAAYNAWPGISGLAADTWYHISMVRLSNGKLKFYRNGELVYDGNSPGDFSSWHNNGARLSIHGQGNGSGYTGGNLTFNDIRIYNYALSEYEVREIAKAKILHYTFDDFQEPTTNLHNDPVLNVNYTENAVVTKSNWGVDGTLYARKSDCPVRDNKSLMLEIDITVAGSGGLYTDLSRNAPSTPFTLVEGKTYTRSWWAKSNQTSKSISGHICSCNRASDNLYILGGNITVTKEWQRFEHTFTLAAGQGGSYHTRHILYNDISTVWITNIQIEEKSYSTEFVNGSRTAKVNDISGFFNHSNVLTETETPKWVEDSKLGIGAYYFNGIGGSPVSGSVITRTDPNMPISINNDFTISLWIKNSGTETGVLLRKGGQIELYKSGNSYVYRTWNPSQVQTTLTYALTVGQWDHIVITHDKTTSKAYINGVLRNTIPYSGAPSSTSEALAIGSYTNRTWSINATIDNFRIYATALSEADIVSLYKRRTNLDSLGNIQAVGVDSTKSYFPSSVDYSTWVIGETSATGWSRNGLVDENIILVKENPARQEDIMWATLQNDATSDADGGFNSSSVSIDKTKKYRYSIWIKRENIGNGRTYFGCGGNTVSNLGAGETINNNPYFTNYISSEKSNIGEQWVLIVSHIHPEGYVGGTDVISGFYDVNGNKISSIATDYKWHSTSTVGSIRAYLFYSTSMTERQYFYRPRVDMIDGNEPSLQDLINCSDNPTLYGKTLSEINKKALFDGKGQTLYRGVDEISGTINPLAQYEITKNGTLIINGEFSEVD